MGHSINSADDVREVIREARGVAKDLAAVIRDGRAMIAEVKAAAEASVNEHLMPVVKSEIEKLTAATEKAIDEAEKAVDARFQTVADILLGEDKRYKKEGNMSIADMARDKVAREEARKHGPSF